jgi:hypothetical protein
MLFKAEAFESPNITSPEKLYSLKVLKGLNEQKLPLKEELDDEFIFCQAVREAAGVRIARELQETTNWMRYRMKIGGQITGFEQVTKPYVLRDGAAKGLNESRKCCLVKLLSSMLTPNPSGCQRFSPELNLTACQH